LYSPSTTARRALVFVTAAAFSGGALVAGAGTASAAPADPDLTGAVVNAAGAALADVGVYAYTTPADGSQPEYVDGTTTDATGHYTFTELDPASLALNSTVPAITSETEFKLYFNWSPTTPADYHTTGYLDRGLGGSKSIRGAGSVVVPANATATAPTQALPTAGGVLLKIVGPTGAPVNYSGYGDLYEPDAYDPMQAYTDSASIGSDDAFYPDGPDAGTDPDAPDDGLVFIDGVEPGASYAVQASGQDYNATTLQYTSYVSRFFGGNGSYPEATPVKVAAGAFTPVTVQLTDKLSTLEEPRIVGNSSFGSKLKADPGTWLGETQSDLDFTYQWFRGSKVVATGDTYKVTKKDKGDKIKLVVTAYGDGFAGSASADPTSKVGEKSRVTAKKLGAGKVAVTVTVAKKKLAKKLGTPQGKVVLMTEDGQMASKKVRLKGGEATLAPKSKYAGEKLVVVYLGGGKLGSDTVSLGGGKKK
jgi:hypothetical protein